MSLRGNLLRTRGTRQGILKALSASVDTKDMQLRTSAAVTLLGVVLYSAGCSSKPAARESEAAAATPAASGGGGDAGALADLQASPKWSGPRCRWLETGAWVVAYPQDTALYRAAYELSYIEMTEVGRANRIGTPEPAWKISLTDSGKAEAATCPPTSKPTSWGVPVSRRQFISGKNAGASGERTVFDVEYAWVPTDVGVRVKFVLTDKMAVEEGTYRTKVYMRKTRGFTGAGANGWSVDQIDERGAVRLR
jgi:hypothetical protein